MPQKLLVVDDDVGMAKVIQLTAGQLGLECEVVTSPAQATGRYIVFQPDILIVDMIMPGKDGIAVLNEILSLGLVPKIVVSSGYGDTWLRLAQGVAKFHALDSIAVLRKPFRRAELVTLLSELAGLAMPPAGRLTETGTDAGTDAETAADPDAEPEPCCL